MLVELLEGALPKGGEPGYAKIRSDCDFIDGFLEFKQLSLCLQDLLKSMIHRDPAKRPRVEDVLFFFDKESKEEHKWLNLVNKSIKNSQLMTKKTQSSKFGFSFQAFKSQ